MHDYTLVLVDVQPSFHAARHRPTLKAIKREVKMAKKRKLPVVLLELPKDVDGNPHLRTHSTITRLLERYKRHTIVKKQNSDGSHELLIECHRLRMERPRFRICGVNTDVCVLKTALGLAQYRPNSLIEVVQDACNSEYDADCWDRFQGASNIVLLPSGA